MTIDTSKATTIPLTVAGGTHVVAHACGACRIVRQTEQAALECCAPRLCDCGAPVAAHRTACEACIARHEHEREQAKFDKTTKVALSDYAGDFLFCPCCDEYFADADVLRDDHEAPREWAFATTPQKFRLNARDIVDSALESQEHHEDAIDTIPRSALDELQTSLDGWCARQGVVSYFADESTVVLLPAPEASDA